MNKKWTPEKLREAENKISGLTRNECEAQGLSGAWQAVYRFKKKHIDKGSHNQLTDSIAENVESLQNKNNTITLTVPLYKVTIPLVQAQNHLKTIYSVFGSSGSMYLFLKENKIIFLSHDEGPFCIGFVCSYLYLAIDDNLRLNGFYISRQNAQKILLSKGTDLIISFYKDYITLNVDNSPKCQIREFKLEIEFSVLFREDKFIYKSTIHEEDIPLSAEFWNNKGQISFTANRKKLLSNIEKFKVMSRKRFKVIPDQLNIKMAIDSSSRNQTVRLAKGMTSLVNTKLDWQGSTFKKTFKKRDGAFIERRVFYRAIKHYPADEVRIAFDETFCYIYAKKPACFVRLHMTPAEFKPISTFKLVECGKSLPDRQHHGIFIHVLKGIKEYIFLSPVGLYNSYDELIKKTNWGFPDIPLPGHSFESLGFPASFDKRIIGTRGKWEIDTQRKILIFKECSDNKLKIKQLKKKILSLKKWSDYEVIMES